MKKAIYFNFKFFFRYISIQSCSSQGDKYSLENGHDNLASLILLAKVEKKIFQEIMHFARYDQYGHALIYKNPCSRGNDIDNFARTFLVFYYYVLTLSARRS